eukprot:907172-Pyramimonas_sp.AAC.1
MCIRDSLSSSAIQTRDIVRCASLRNRGECLAPGSVQRVALERAQTTPRHLAGEQEPAAHVITSRSYRSNSQMWRGCLGSEAYRNMGSWAPVALDFCA